MLVSFFLYGAHTRFFFGPSQCLDSVDPFAQTIDALLALVEAAKHGFDPVVIAKHNIDD
jgi:hypothetical protein